MLGTRYPLPMYPCTRYRVLATRLSVTRYPLLVIPCPCPLSATCPGHASLLGLTTTVCLPLSLYASGAAFVCLPVNQRFVVALPALTGTYNCLIVNVVVVVVVVVILENIFLKIFLHIFSVQLRNSYKFQNRGPTRR